MKRVFIYCRVSTAGQLNGDGFDRQEEACRQLAAKRGWVVSRVFREQQTGSDEWTDRKILSEVMDLAGTDVKTGFVAPTNKYNLGVNDPPQPVDTIIIERADRLSRDLIVSELFLRECKNRGIKVYAADCDADLVNGDEDPTRTLIRQVLGAVAQWEKSVIVKKMQAGRRAKSLKTGKPCGGPAPSPYGDRGDFAQRNAERIVIAHILQMNREGKTFKYITERLRNLRIKTPNGDWGRRVQGVNVDFWWTEKTVYRLVRLWRDRTEELK